MKPKKSLLTLMAIAAICVTACKKPPIPNPNPSTTFNNIWVNGGCNITFIQGTSNNVISADPTVMYFQMGNTLMINGMGNVSIELKQLDTLFSNGKSIVNGSAVTLLKDIVVACNGQDSVSLSINATDSISVLLNGNGYYTFSGNTPKLNIASNSGGGTFLGYNLASTNCNIASNGSGNSEIYVTGTLNAWLNGTGNIYYKGNPTTVNPYVNGTGQLIKK